MEEDTSTNYSTIIISVLMAIVIIATVMMPIITATTQTTTTTEIDNEGEGWLKLGYNSGKDFDFEITNENSNIIIGDQTGLMGDNIFYADSKNVIFADSDKNAIFLLNTDSSSVHKFSSIVSVENTGGTLNISDGTETVISSDSPTWAYVPDANGVYGFFTDGGLNLEEDKPKVAIGYYAGVGAYNNVVIAPNDLGTLGLILSGNYADEDVTWEKENTSQTIDENEPDSESVGGIDSATATEYGSYANPTYTVGDWGFDVITGVSARVVKYTGTSNNITIPGQFVNGNTTYVVTEIGAGSYSSPLIPSTISDVTLSFDLTAINVQIKDYAFKGVDFDGSVTLPDNISVIGNYVFQDTNLSSVILSNNLTRIESYAFSGTEISSISFPSSLTTIRNGAFSNCANLTGTIILPENVRILDENAFNRSPISNVIFQTNNLTTIGGGAFANTNLSGVFTIPASVMKLGSETGSYVNAGVFENTNISGFVFSGDFIGYNTFKGCTNLTGTLTIPENVKIIRPGAFSGTGYTSIQFNNVLEELGSVHGTDNISRTYSTFNEVPLTGNIVFPSSLKYLGGYSFYNQKNVTFVFNEGLETITSSACHGCDGITSLTLPTTLKTLGKGAFSNCVNLTSVVLNDGLEIIGDGLNVQSDGPFSYCSSLTGPLHIPTSVTMIGAYAFSSTGISGELIIPSNVVFHGYGQFDSCRNLTSLVIEEGVTYDSSWKSATFRNCSGLTGVITIPGSLGFVANSMFGNCSNIDGIILSEGLTAIGDGNSSVGSFEGCTSLDGTIVFPSTMNSIAKFSFRNCNNVDSLIFLADEITIGENALAMSGVTEVLNLGTTEITTTSYGLNADSVQDYVSALGYIAPTSIHETVIVEDTSLSATLLKLLPVFMALAVVIFIGYALLRPDSDFIKSLKSRF